MYLDASVCVHNVQCTCTLFLNALFSCCPAVVASAATAAGIDAIVVLTVRFRFSSFRYERAASFFLILIVPQTGMGNHIFISVVVFLVLFSVFFFSNTISSIASELAWCFHNRSLKDEMWMDSIVVGRSFVCSVCFFPLLFHFFPYNSFISFDAMCGRSFFPLFALTKLSIFFKWSQKASANFSAHGIFLCISMSARARSRDHPYPFARLLARVHRYVHSFCMPWVGPTRCDYTIFSISFDLVALIGW